MNARLFLLEPGKLGVKVFEGVGVMLGVSVGLIASITDSCM